jgi:hypothetical protein
MHMPPGCSVGILRPPSVEMSRLLSDQVDRRRSVSAAEKAAHVDEQIDQIVEMFRMAADGLDMRLNVTQYQMHGFDMRPLGRKRGRRFGQNDILATIDPTPAAYAFTTGTRDHHPLQRAVVAYTDPAEFEDAQALLGTGKVDMVGTRLNEHHYALRRVFAICTTLYEDQAANRFDANAKVVRQAVLYPRIPLQETARHEGELLEPGDAISSRQARRFFVEKATDRKE